VFSANSHLQGGTDPPPGIDGEGDEFADPILIQDLERVV
jgi:hypothetical protein